MYYLQQKAPAGNWVDNLGTCDLQHCISHMEYLNRIYNKYEYRIVVKEITVIIGDEK